MIKRILVVLSGIVLTGYLVLCMPHWLKDYRHHIVARDNPLYSEPLDLSKPNTFTWNIKAQDWYNPLDSWVSIYLDTQPSIADSKLLNLRARIEAKEIGDKRNFDRLQFTNSLPDNAYPPEKGMADGKMANMIFRGGRDYQITLRVFTPDPLLSKANPRLKIQADYDHKIVGGYEFFQMTLYLILALSFLALGYLFREAWRKA